MRDHKGITIYTDGSCLRNPAGPGGWAYYFVINGKEYKEAGGKAETTSNQMELMAVIKALQKLKALRVFNVSRANITSDSQYVCKGGTEWVRGWARRNWMTAAKTPVANRELWEEILGLMDYFEVSFTWVRGHSGNPGNELVDKLAYGAAQLARGG